MGKSNPGSGSKKCKDAELGASVAGAMMIEDIRMGQKMMQNSLLSKPGLLEGICFKDVSVEELGHASRQNCVFLSTWEKGHVARYSHKSLSPLASQAPANCLPTTISPLLHARN